VPPEGELRIGTSGYQYAHWRDVFYPSDLARDDWLTHYAGRFSTVEMDTTFYGLPARDTVTGWKQSVPRGFRFAVKLSRYGTHMKRLREPRSGWLERFLDAVSPLGAALGPILVQLPPRWNRDVERLAGFLDVAPRRHQWAVEFRDADWLDGSVYDVLREHRAALVVHDLIDDHPRLTTTEWVYLRFHGPRAGQPYIGSYSSQALSGAARRIRDHLRAGRDVYAYFNNDARGDAVRDASTLRRYLEER
jgi:uncharacterized protein YecE (DUF72 family)